MLVRVSYASTSWEYGWARGSVDHDDAVEFPDRRSALLFLLPFKSDAQFIPGLRRLLAERSRRYALARVSDQQVLEETAWLLATRQLWLKQSYRAILTRRPGEKAAQPSRALPVQPEARESFAPPEPPPDEPVFLPNIDAAAIAAAQRRAAQSGKPFCLE